MAINGSVLLGYVDEEISPIDSYETNFMTNKIGGFPNWQYPFDLALSTDLLNCSLCHMRLALILQIYAPLENSRFHRTLYLFACLNQKCQNSSQSWKCFRLQTLELPSIASDKQELVSSFQWTESADDWGISENEEEQQTLASFSSLFIGSERRNGNTRRNNESLCCLTRSFYLAVYEENNEENKPNDLERPACTDTSSIDEEYEKSQPKHGDVEFYKFLKIIRANPGHIIRYSRKSKPLLYSPQPIRIFGNCCTECGGPLTFEFQLLPTLIPRIGSQVEFGSILVLTCLQNCWPSVKCCDTQQQLYRIEHVIVIPET